MNCETCKKRRQFHFLHRYIMQKLYKVKESEEVVHMNLDTLDNRRCNLLIFSCGMRMYNPYIFCFERGQGAKGVRKRSG